MRNNGFTLADLMITLAVAAIVLTAGVPALGGFIAAQRVTTNSNLLVTNLNFARTRAITDYRNVAMCPSTDGKACTGGNRWENGWIVFVDGRETWEPESAEDILRVSGPRPSVRISSTRPRIRYLTDGRATGTNLTITVCDPARPDRSRDLVVSNTGRVRSQNSPRESCG